jgi:hypothetical protein
MKCDVGRKRLNAIVGPGKKEGETEEQSGELEVR